MNIPALVYIHRRNATSAVKDYINLPQVDSLECFFRQEKLCGGLCESLRVILLSNMGLINKVDMVCLSPVGYGV